MSIRPYEKNPAYWEYRGEPILLLGGSDEDNPFQWTGTQLTGHLDLMVDVGANYLRNTMSDRDPGNVVAFAETGDGRYDLARWNDEYWRRLAFLLAETHRRGIIVQLTFWDQHDLRSSRWPDHPWNSENNVNYTADDVPDLGAFFASVDNENNQVLQWQERYVDRILEISLAYDHVLYNINNESWTGRVWERHWTRHLLETAADYEQEVYVTAMHMRPESTVRGALSEPEYFGYADISQNNQDSKGASGRQHMANILKWRRILHALRPIPMNNVKVYGVGAGHNPGAGTALEAVQRCWRNIFGGCAATRFHRPAEGRWGIGLGDLAQTNIRSARMFCDEVPVFELEPLPQLLHEPWGQAYCLARPGAIYAVYMPTRAYVYLDPWVEVDTMELRWLEIDRSRWHEPQTIAVDWQLENNGPNRGRIYLQTPGNGQWVALLRPGSS